MQKRKFFSYRKQTNFDLFISDKMTQRKLLQSTFPFITNNDKKTRINKMIRV